MKSDPVVRDFFSKIRTIRPQLRTVILFGSRARETSRVDSDYDLLIVVSKKDPALVDKLYEAALDMLLTHGRLISLKIFF